MEEKIDTDGKKLRPLYAAFNGGYEEGKSLNKAVSVHDFLENWNGDETYLRDVEKHVGNIQLDQSLTQALPKISAEH